MTGNPPDPAAAIDRGAPSVPGTARPARLRRRLASAVYEALLLVAILMVAGFALLPWVSPAPGSSAKTVYLMGAPQRIAAFLYFLAIAAVYFCWLWSDGRRTLPMKTWRLRLETTRGTVPRAGTALRRYLATLIGPALGIAAYALLAPLGLGRLAWLAVGINFAWAFVDPDRAFLHDRVARTRLVEADDPRRPESVP